MKTLSVRRFQQTGVEALMDFDGCADYGLREFVQIGHKQPPVGKILKRRGAESAEEMLKSKLCDLSVSAFLSFSRRVTFIEVEVEPTRHCGH